MTVTWKRFFVSVCEGLGGRVGVPYIHCLFDIENDIGKENEKCMCVELCSINSQCVNLK